MKPIDLRDFAQIVGGETDAVGSFSGFALDSGDVRPGDLFLAIRGSRVDGHDYAETAITSGAVAALVERPIQGPFILVPNLVEALARYGRTIRETFNGPVVGITGSAGKTTTKEFVAAALSPLGGVLKTEGNRNTEYTSPLVWADLDDQATAVIEMAMRGFGQIAHLARISRPTIGVITNIGYSHLEQVGTREGIAQAKGEIFSQMSEEGTAVVWAEDEYLGTLTEYAKPRALATFGFGENAMCRLTGYRAVNWESAIVEGTLSGQTWTAKLPVLGRHIALNAAAAVLIANLCGVEMQNAADQIPSAKLPPLRMEWIERNGVRILMDNYNASPPAMLAAIETLADVPAEGRRLAVLGEMRELGTYTESAHRAAGRAVVSAKLDAVALVGEPTEHLRDEAIANGFDANRLSQASSLADVRHFIDSAQPGDVVLVKGSRALELEKALAD